MARAEFGAWLPDLPAIENPGAILVKNCIPLATSYGELRALAPFTDALTAAAKGVFWARSASDTVFVFAGDAAKLYMLSGSTTWSGISQPATTYSAGFWDFGLFSNRVIATDGGATNIQYYDMGVSATFLDLPGSPPRARVLGTVRDFVVLGNIVGDPDLGPDGLVWSGFNNSELYTPSLSTQSDRQALRGTGGAVRRIVSGDVGVIFQERSVQRMTYVGPPTVMRIDEFLTNHGTFAPRSVAWTKDYVFYYASDGFYRMDRASYAVTPIGVNKVNNWFSALIPASEVPNIVGAVGALANIVYWVFRSSSGSANYDRMLMYNWVVDRWAHAEIETQLIGQFASQGANLDTLDALLGGNIDSASIVVDSDSFAGGTADLIGFASDNTAGGFSGAPLTAEIDTAEFAGDGAMLDIQGVRPIVDAPGATIDVAPITRNTLTENPVTGSFVPLSRIGIANTRQNKRYHRYRVRVAGGFAHAKRIDYEPKARGSR